MEEKVLVDTGCLNSYVHCQKIVNIKALMKDVIQKLDVINTVLQQLSLHTLH